jgi:peroxiredoxin Q/BCP
MLRFAALAVATAAFALAAPAGSANEAPNVKVGDKFPDVPLPAAQIDKVKKGAKTLSVADLKGKTVIVFFYPKALTGGCTKESCGFRDLMKAKDFPADVVVLGASADDLALQQKFIDTNKLPMPLLADTDMKLIKELGIRNGANGKTPKRVTYVIDKDGRIAKIYDKVDVNMHPKEVLEYAKSLK